MNVNLVKKLAQNSRKCSKLIDKCLGHNKLYNSKQIRHSSTFAELANHRKNYHNGYFLLNNSPKRCYCDGTSPPANKLPPLMDFPQLVWPSIFKSFKNLLLATFIIKPYFDPEFNLPDFVTGSKKAVEVVSHKLCDGNIKELGGLVTSEIIPDLQKSVSLLSLGQRELLSINTEDIYFAFPYQIGIMFKDDDQPQNQKRFVEITMVYHTLKGLGVMRSAGEEPPLNVGMLPEYQSKISICNYRFIKEFTKGIESDWTVNLLNHFRPVDNIDNEMI